jgi:hypothetical protein
MYTNLLKLMKKSGNMLRVRTRMVVISCLPFLLREPAVRLTSRHSLSNGSKIGNDAMIDPFDEIQCEEYYNKSFPDAWELAYSLFFEVRTNATNSDTYKRTDQHEGTVEDTQG